ncbi:glycosyltransferase [bacterium]|nr:glycosyltransferase [bacterium]
MFPSKYVNGNKKNQRKLENSPRISIVTPSYNQGRYLEETILSVLNQNYPDLEYIIIDGGSADNSVEIIKKYSKDLAFWVSEADRGQSHAINKGIARATGEIINWINSDDLLCDGSLQKVGAFFQKNPEAEVCYGDFIPIDETGVELTYGRCLPFSKRMLLCGVGLPQQSTFFRRDLINTCGGIDESLHLSMDYELYLRFAFNGCKFGCIKEPLGKFRIYNETKSNISKKNGSFINEKKAVQMRYLKRYYHTQDISLLQRWFWWFTFMKWISNIDVYMLHWRFYLNRLKKGKIGKGMTL